MCSYGLPLIAPVEPDSAWGTSCDERRCGSLLFPQTEVRWVLLVLLQLPVPQSSHEMFSLGGAAVSIPHLFSPGHLWLALSPFH